MLYCSLIKLALIKVLLLLTFRRRTNVLLSCDCKLATSSNPVELSCFSFGFLFSTNNKQPPTFTLSIAFLTKTALFNWSTAITRLQFESIASDLNTSFSVTRIPSSSSCSVIGAGVSVNTVTSACWNARILRKLISIFFYKLYLHLV